MQRLEVSGAVRPIYGSLGVKRLSMWWLHTLQAVLHCVLHGCSESVFSSICKGKSKRKAIPLQAWTGPEGSRSLRLPDFKTINTRRWKGCQPYSSAAFTPQEIFLLLISVRGWINPRTIAAAWRIMSLNNSHDTIGYRTRNLPACRAVPQPTVSLRTPCPVPRAPYPKCNVSLVEAPRFQDSRHMKVVTLSTLHTGHLYSPHTGNIPGTHFC